MNIRSFLSNPPIKFILTFIGLFLLFYYFNLFFIGVTSPGNFYSSFLAEHVNYIRGLRHLLLYCSSTILNWLGYTSIFNDYQLLVVGRGTLQLVYSCLGLGVMSFFTAFVIAYPKKLIAKVIFIVSGLLVIQLLNILRFVLLSLFWNKKEGTIIDHHAIFNAIIYLIIAVSIYFWIKHDDNKPLNRAAN